MFRHKFEMVVGTTVLAGALMASAGRAADAAPPVTAQTVFTLKTMPMAPKAIVSQQGVADAARLLESQPVRLEPGAGAAEVVVDFGRELVGTLQLGVRADAASKLEIRYGEGLQEVHRDTDYAARWYKRPKDFLDVKEGQQMLSNHGPRALSGQRGRLILLFRPSTQQDLGDCCLLDQAVHAAIL